MYDLKYYCENWLDNADLDINIYTKDKQETIELIFYVVGYSKKLILNCTKVVKYSLEKESDDLPLYAVFATHIKQYNRDDLLKYIDFEFHEALNSKLWFIRVLEGDAKIDLICEKLQWNIKDISESERKWYKN